MKGFYKMRLLACVLPLALGLSACGSSSSSAANNAIAPPDSSLTTVSYVIFSNPARIIKTCVGEGSNNIVGGGFIAPEPSDEQDRRFYGTGWCSNWANLSNIPPANNPSAYLRDITATLSGGVTDPFDISEFVIHSESIVSAKLTMNFSVDTREAYLNRINAVNLDPGLSLDVYLGSGATPTINSVYVPAGRVERLGENLPAVVGINYEMDLSDDALRFLAAHPVFHLKFLGKAIYIHYGNRGGSTDVNGDPYPNVSPKLELTLNNYTPPG